MNNNTTTILIAPPTGGPLLKITLPSRFVTDAGEILWSEVFDNCKMETNR